MAGSVVTAVGDGRVFPFGRWLRRLKLDELPQMVNIIKGDMTFVGPRPRDPKIVEQCYTPLHRETLEVLPGLTSPGTLFYLTSGGTHPPGSESRDRIPGAVSCRGNWRSTSTMSETSRPGSMSG